MGIDCSRADSLIWQEEVREDSRLSWGGAFIEEQRESGGVLVRWVLGIAISGKFRAL